MGSPLAAVPVFTDRHKGIISATTEFGIFNMFCVHHIIGNMRSDKSVWLAVSQEKYVWATNAATTVIDFNFNTQKLAKVSPVTKSYLDQISVKQWTLYLHYHTARLYGWRTTNFAELTTNFAELTTNFAELTTNLAKRTTNFAELTTNFAELTTNFAELTTNFAKPTA
ncbi:hypothetical protein G195_011563 [Phytophthora kernoviae 00238/432]|uniref:Uncharacterized protein n=1 Tax=Phytophthora kernoviae 00238/432 TaxID=1284355 RepID=A0A8J4RY01_9STRA|nr:hypothetical protein G195_011563 [Phytophthora kernoviae 00238/432]